LKTRIDNSEVVEKFKMITRGAVDLLPEGDFEERICQALSGSKPLRVKQGFDPTSPDIHIGHTVSIRKLKHFQDLDQKVILIVGDYTALIGDPSGRSATRPKVDYDAVMKNAETYQNQFFKILDKSKTEVRFNSEWFKEMNFQEIMSLAGRFTVARLLERDDFSKRLAKGTPISIHELFYPLMQGYDSVAIEADVEIGGTDQTFNLLAGRTIQESYGQRAQVVLTMPLLVGLDGEQKMSKSLDNYIGIDDSPREIFGRAMSIPDDLIYTYFELATDIALERLEEVKKALAQPDVNPMLIKKELGETLVDMYQPAESGRAAREEFERVFSKKELPDEMPEIDRDEVSKLDLDPDKVYLVRLMSTCKLAKSNGEARKLIKAGAVSIDGEKIDDVDYEFALGREMVLKVGKRRFLKLLK